MRFIIGRNKVRGPVGGGPIGGDLSAIARAWILLTGFWDDAGAWRDDEVWID